MDLPARPDLPGWEDLPFWRTAWPDLRARLAADTRTCLPAPSRVFRALEQPPDAVRVVILGQDPYHTPGKADGLAFSIPQDFGGRLDSLGNILRELESDLGSPRTRTDLSDWADQGVMLLNTALTVPEGRAKGHAGWGWKGLVRDVLTRLGDRPRAILLWGNDARALRSGVPDAGHLFVESAHPSPLAAGGDFLGSRPFSRVNAWLAERRTDPIDWSGPPPQTAVSTPPAQGARPRHR